MKLSDETKVSVYSGVVDLRKGANGLRALVGKTEDEKLYLFSNRSRRLLKYLQVDRFGVSIGTRRLRRGHFLWPESPSGCQTLNLTELEYLLNGNCIKKLRIKTLFSGKT